MPRKRTLGPPLLDLVAPFTDPDGEIIPVKRALDQADAVREQAFGAVIRAVRIPKENLIRAVVKAWSAAAQGTGYPNVQISHYEPTISVTVEAISPLGTIKVRWTYTPDGESLDGWVQRVGSAWAAMSRAPEKA